MSFFLSQQAAWRSFLLVMEQKPRRALNKFTEPVYRAWLEYFRHIGECNLMCIKIFKKRVHIPQFGMVFMHSILNSFLQEQDHCNVDV